MTGSGALVEVQGTAEGEPFSRNQLNELVDLAEVGVRELTEIQRRALADAAPAP
jgi:ribonuclease PH